MSINETRASIFTAAQYGTLDQFVRLFERHYLNEKSEIGSGLLHYAISGQNYDIALFLIEQGIDVAMANNEGKTALHCICETPNLDVAKAILARGGKIDVKDKYGNSAMWTAVFNCKGKFYDMVKLFMQYGPDVRSVNKNGKSPLDFAVQVGNEKLLQILLGNE